MPIWIVNTSANRAILPHPNDGEPSLGGKGWTVYDVAKPHARLQNGINVLDTLHLHHAFMNELRVFGVSEAEALDPEWAIAGFEYRGFFEQAAAFGCGHYNFD